MLQLHKKEIKTINIFEDLETINNLNPGKANSGDWWNLIYSD